MYQQPGMQQPGIAPGLVATPVGYGPQGQIGPGSALPPPPPPGQGQQQQQSQPQRTGITAKKPRRRVLTSLSLQIFLFFGSWWDVFYYVLNILVFVYKGGSGCHGPWDLGFI